MNLPARIVIWGLGDEFNRIWSKISKEGVKGNIRIIGLIDRKLDKMVIEGIKVNSPKMILDIDFDYLIVTSRKFFQDISMEAVSLGIDCWRIIPGEIFEEDDFDWRKYDESNLLQHGYIKNNISDNSYVDKVRYYCNKDVEFFLGRKSYVAGAQLECAPASPRHRVYIGNFTSISWNVLIMLGLNMDHDYHRVYNYGSTHFFSDDQNDYSNIKFSTCNLRIGSDVWIGRGTKIGCFRDISIGNGAVIAAESFIVDDVPPFAIVGGNPARFIKYRFSKQIAEGLQKLSWWEWELNKIKEHMNLMDNPRELLSRYKLL